MTDVPAKTLILFELRMLGDALLSLPFLRAAVQQYKVYVVCRPACAEIFRFHLPEENILTWNPPWIETRAGEARGSIRKIIQRVERLSPELAVCAWADARVQYIMQATRASERVGFYMNPANLIGSHLSWRKRQILIGQIIRVLSGLFLRGQPLTRPLERRSAEEPILETWRALAQALGLDLVLDTPWLIPSEGHFPVALQEFVVSDPGETWLVHPGARKAVRRWPADRYIEIVRRLADAGRRVILIDPPDSPALQVDHKNIVHFAPPDLPGFVSVVHAADAVLCNDTAPAHLAAALGKRVVSIFGPQNPDVFAPFNNRENVVAVDQCKFRPCMDRCQMPEVICMNGVTVNQVWERVGIS